MAKLHGPQYVKEFARQMWMQLGMRVLILSAHHDSTGTLSLATWVIYSFHILLSQVFLLQQPWLQWGFWWAINIAMTSVQPGWEHEPIMNEWARFVKTQMGESPQCPQISVTIFPSVKTPMMKMSPTENCQPERSGRNIYYEWIKMGVRSYLTPTREIWN